MKIVTKELYSIEDLTKEEVVFLLELVRKVKFAKNSSELSYKIQQKFIDLGDEIAPLQCDGCSANGQGVLYQICPCTNLLLPLCDSCLSSRENINQEARD